VTVVRKQQASVTANAVSSLDVSLPNPATAGYLLVVGVGQTASVVPVVGGVTDDQGSVYNRDAVGLALNADGQRCAIFSAENIGGGPTTITYTPSEVQALNVVAVEYANVATVGALDVTGSGGSDTAGTTQDSGWTELSNNPDSLVVAMVVVESSGVPDPADVPDVDSPFVEVTRYHTDPVYAVVERVLTVAEAQRCTWTTSSAARWDSCIAVYRALQSAADESRGYLLGTSDVAGRYPWDAEA
jgi:hypothetical protein